MRGCGPGWIGALLLIASVHAQAPRPERAWPVSEAPEALRASVARADLIVVSMQNALLRELTTALGSSGPEGAVKTCHVEVSGIMARVGRQEGVAAGRTSDRLRNPGNAPRAWAAPLVTAHAGRPAREVEGFAVDLGDRVGVLRPIAHRPLCVSCHGSPQELDAGAHAAIAARYPADRATGFAEGEIRGWFWVEVPKSAR
jgi:hypothetical protein